MYILLGFAVPGKVTVSLAFYASFGFWEQLASLSVLALDHYSVVHRFVRRLEAYDQKRHPLCGFPYVDGFDPSNLVDGSWRQSAGPLHPSAHLEACLSKPTIRNATLCVASRRWMGLIHLTS